MAHGHGWTDPLSGLGSYFFSLGLCSHPYDRTKIEQVDVKITKYLTARTRPTEVVVFKSSSGNKQQAPRGADVRPTGR